MKEIANSIIMEERSIGFVPTMGALHEGHLSLVRRAREENDVVVVSIFVNPIQFSQGEDFERYPRDLEGDMKKLEGEGVDILFAPHTKDIYPEGYRTYVEVEGLSSKLCGLVRPGHFRGVATVVTKLFNIVKPKRAYFGLKDYQQTVILRRMVTDLNMDVEVITCPTVREDDGLAMSSRNLYLNPSERRAATVIYRTLKDMERLIKEGKRDVSELKGIMEASLRGEPLVRFIDYASIYDPETLDEVDVVKGRVLIAIALRIGSARLIDNLIVDI